MNVNCLLISNNNSECISNIRCLCEEIDVKLNYTHSLITFFERYYELMPQIVIIDCECNSFLLKQAIEEFPVIFYNAIFIDKNIDEYKEIIEKHKNVIISTCEELKRVMISKVELVKKIFAYSKDKYDGVLINNKMTEILNELGIKSNLKGYSILKELLFCSCSNRYSSLTTTTKMYPVVARKMSITVYSLERNIRTLITTSYKLKDSLLKVKFPKRAPTNKQLINYIIERMKIDTEDYIEKTQFNIPYYSSKIDKIS